MNKKLYIVIDESGTFASNESNFVFAGYLILGTENYNGSVRKYNQIEKRHHLNGELKANTAESFIRRELIEIMKSQTSFAVCFKNDYFATSQNMTSTAKNILKDNILLNLILDVLDQVEIDLVDEIIIEIDEQNFSSGIKQNLYISLYKRLFTGYFDNFHFKKPLLGKPIKLTVIYVDSKAYSLVRSADMLANETLRKLNEDADLSEILKIFKVL